VLLGETLMRTMAMVQIRAGVDQRSLGNIVQQVSAIWASAASQG
jgi:hypothetical protein